MGLLDSIQNRQSSPLQPKAAPPVNALRPSTSSAPTGFSGASGFEAGRPSPQLLSLQDARPQLPEIDFHKHAEDHEDPDYTPPSEETDGAVPADEAQRSPEEAAAQQAVIEEAVDSGEPVQFTNSNGQTEAFTFERDGDAYVVTDSHGNSFRVEPQEGLTEDELLQGVAAFTDYYSQYPEHLRGALEKIELYPGEKRASFNNEEKRFKMGMDDLDEMTFDHEMGHAIGYQAGNQDDGFFESLWEDVTGDRGVPEGWEDAMEDDGVAPSEYANTNEREDFGEAWLAYVEARERGPEAVEELREKYPNRVAIMEEIWNGTYEG